MKTKSVFHLSQNYNPKLSDFGLAKDGPAEDKSHVSTRVLGTYGYAAPEYVATGTISSFNNQVMLHFLFVSFGTKCWLIFMAGHLTAKSDVYSFGVVLVEMLSGRRAMDKSRPSRQRNLVEWAKPYLANKRKLLRVMDTRLEGQYTIDDAYNVAILALRCISFESKLRPTMEEVVSTLQKLQVPNVVNGGKNKSSLDRPSRRKSEGDAKNLKTTTTAYPRPFASSIYA